MILISFPAGLFLSDKCILRVLRRIDHLANPRQSITASRQVSARSMWGASANPIMPRYSVENRSMLSIDDLPDFRSIRQKRINPLPYATDEQRRMNRAFRGGGRGNVQEKVEGINGTRKTAILYRRPHEGLRYSPRKTAWLVYADSLCWRL
jgi:hypothetical protein